MDDNMTEQKPSVTAEKTRGLGWVWVAAIVIVVAGVLYLTQRKAPGNDGANSNTNEVTSPVVKDIPVTPTLGSMPKSVPTGALFGLDWKVDATEQTFASATGLVWDDTSHTGTLGTEVSPDASGYPFATTAFTNGLTAVPGTFEDNMKLQGKGAAGAMYLRVYATVADKTYWSQEYVIPTKAENGSTEGGS